MSALVRDLRRRVLLAAAVAALLAALAACAPATQPALPATTAARQLEKTAEIVYHRMAIGYLETGSYTTNVLVDVKLPAGARWTLESYASDGSSYRLKITSSKVAGLAWRVSPAGVRRVAAH